MPINIGSTPAWAQDTIRARGFSDLTKKSKVMMTWSLKDERVFTLRHKLITLAGAACVHKN